MKKKFLLSILILFIFLSTACSSPGILTGDFLISVTEIALYNGNISAAEKEIYQFLKDFEQKTSVNLPDSDISKLNSAKAFEKVYVDKDIINMLNLCKDMVIKTSGEYNPCIYPVFKLYDFINKTVPTDQEINSMLPYTNFNDLEIGENYIIKKYDYMQVDLGSIAKGYATDKCVEIAKKHNVTSGVIDIGRNIYLIGYNMSGGKNVPFNVGVTCPRGGYLFGKIKLSDISAVTSGDYERYFMLDGVRYSHIIDGATGKRSNTDIISATIFGTNSTICEIYSTSLFLMGMEKAIKFASENNLKVLLINEDLKYYASGGLEFYDISDKYSIWTS